MRLVITQNITLDGVVEQSERTGDWFSVASGGDNAADVEAAMQEMMNAEDAQLYGRKTFEAMRGFWPNQTDDTTGVSAHLNAVDKYVISTTMDEPDWENSTVLHDDLVDEVQTLKDRPGANLGVTGSISVCRALIAAGLVDEYRLLSYPVVVGTGQRLFDIDGISTLKMALLDTTPFASGVVLLRYQPN